MHWGAFKQGRAERFPADNGFKLQLASPTCTLILYDQRGPYPAASAFAEASVPLVLFAVQVYRLWPGAV
jgi:hypothetical protein